MSSEQNIFVEAYPQIERALRAYLLAATGNLHETDDLHQVVWQALWNKLDQYDPERPFKAWAFGVARLEVLKWRQSKARSRLVFSEETLTRLADTAEEKNEALAARHTFLIDCMNQLDARARRAVDMKYAQRMRSVQIAEAIGRSVTAVNTMLSRTRQVLRACVERKVAEAG